ncbi:phosphatases II [Pelomyxa schiedti]|nr:phosphatases II [Pelomyxa schiedti]
MKKQPPRGGRGSSSRHGASTPPSPSTTTAKAPPAASATTATTTCAATTPPATATATAAATAVTSSTNPSRYTNWGVPGRVLVGAFPRAETLAAALASGVTVFVCLVQEDEMTRSGGMYLERARKMVTDSPTKYPGVKARDLELIHFPMYDKQTRSDPETADLIRILLEKLEQGKILYLHCMGGHGRTGTILSLLLGRMNGISAAEALALCEERHETRQECIEKPGMYKSPETHEQKSQVYRMLSKEGAF